MRNGFRVLDCDRHIMEPPEIWAEYIEPEFRERGPIYPRFSGAPALIPGLPDVNPRRDIGARGMDHNPRWRTVYYEAMRAGFSAASYLADMDREGVDTAVCYPTVGLYATWRDDIEPRHAAAICRAYNRWLADYCSADPERLKGVALLPMQDLELAIVEARYGVRDLGLVGFFYRPNPVGRRRPDAPEMERFYAAIADLDVPLCFHEGALTPLPQARLPYEPSNSYGRHICCHPMEQMLSLLAMCGLGVFARHPTLRAGFFESGASWLPAWLERLDRLHANKALGADAPTPEPPSYYFRRQGFISGEGHEELLPAMVRMYGDGVEMWASDYPHPDEVDVFPHAVDPLVADERISRASRQRILWDNPARCYGIEARVPATV
jgi:predicted TIM-barrel fold metal-dependent hydrolase